MNITHVSYVIIIRNKFLSVNNNDITYIRTTYNRFHYADSAHKNESNNPHKALQHSYENITHDHFIIYGFRNANRVK